MTGLQTIQICDQIEIWLKYFRNVRISIKLRKGLGKLESTSMGKCILKEYVQRYIGFGKDPCGGGAQGLLTGRQGPKLKQWPQDERRGTSGESGRGGSIR